MTFSLREAKEKIMKHLLNLEVPLRWHDPKRHENVKCLIDKLKELEKQPIFSNIEDKKDFVTHLITILKGIYDDYNKGTVDELD